MSKRELKANLQQILAIVRHLFVWIPIACYVGLAAGTASAILLASLTFATNYREGHVWLILLLAPAGWLMGLMYRDFGRSVEAGNNLVLEQIHKPKDVIPFRMTPLILIGTFLTHLFGGSAGREGTAVQTGASLADQLSRPLKLSPANRRILLMAGVSAGFASVFGTPLAGAVFGMEVLAIGTVAYDAIASCFLSAFLGDMVTRWWENYLPGVHHTVYAVADVPTMSVRTIVYASIAGIAFGLTAMIFARLTHTISAVTKRLIPRSELRPAVGGLLVTALVFGLGTSHTLKYVGLGIPTIVAAFHTHLPAHDFAAKLAFTSLTLGTGLKGGEVTPLFYIGATLGNALSSILPLSPSLLAGMGFVAVFAGAANTPLASTLMAVELFGGEAGAYAAIACVVAYLFSGHSGIYSAQRVGLRKPLQHDEERLPLSVEAKAQADGNFGS